VFGAAHVLHLLGNGRFSGVDVGDNAYVAECFEFAGHVSGDLNVEADCNSCESVSDLARTIDKGTRETTTGNQQTSHNMLQVVCPPKDTPKPAHKRTKSWRNRIFTTMREYFQAKYCPHDEPDDCPGRP